MDTYIKKILNKLARQTFYKCLDKMYDLEDFRQIALMKFYEYRDDDLPLAIHKVKCDLLDVVDYKIKLHYNLCYLHDDYDIPQQGTQEHEYFMSELCSRITDRDQEVFTRLFILGESARAIAKDMGVHETNIAQRKSRIVKQLRSVL